MKTQTSSYECEICGRDLSAVESVAKGYGPECAQRRAGFIASCGTTDQEIATLESAGESSARWIRNFRQDMRAGRVRQARQCIDAARRNAQPSFVLFQSLNHSSEAHNAAS